MAQGVPAIYRVHEPPDERRLREYREDVLSHHVPVGNLTKRTEIQKLLEKLGTISIGPALKIGFLRSLMRARYAVEPLGHYGLAKTKYAHFTSPIRRYADLVVHRALFQKSHGSAHSLKETADHISDTERNSADAERDSKDVKLYAFLRAQLKMPNPPRYPALVTDVRNFGFFVDVPGLAMSGLVPLSTVEDDFYVFDSERTQLVGRRNRRVIRLGDKVQVQIAKVDSFKKQVDFRLAIEAGEFTKRPPAARQPAARQPAARQPVARPPEQKKPWQRESRPPQKFGDRKFGGRGGSGGGSSRQRRPKR
jgi:ribonuclease R